MYVINDSPNVYNRLRTSTTLIFHSGAFRLSLGASISLLAIYLISREVDVKTVFATMGNLSIPYLGLALASVAVNTLGKAIRWQLLLGPRGRSISLSRIVASLLAGQLLNALLPIRLGDLSRAYDVGGQGVGRTFTFGSILIEKAIDWVCLALVVALLFVFLPVPSWLIHSVLYILVIVMVIVVATLVLMKRTRWVRALAQITVARLPGAAREWFVPRAQAAFASLEVLGARTAIIRLAICSAVIWCTAIWTNQLIFETLNLQLPFSAACLLLVVLLAGVSIPNVAAGIGIFETLCIFSLGLFGIDTARAFSAAVLLHMVTLLPMLLIGPANILSSWRSKHILQPKIQKG